MAADKKTHRHTHTGDDIPLAEVAALAQRIFEERGREESLAEACWDEALRRLRLQKERPGQPDPTS